MRVLTLTDPLAPVGPNACGGAEQAAWMALRTLDRRRDLALDWIGASGSNGPAARFRTWPELLRWHGLWRPLPALVGRAALADLQQRCNQALAREVAFDPPDLIHNQGAFLGGPAATAHVPMLFTLHLARTLYPAGLFQTTPPHLHFQCVSGTQWETYRELACCGVIGNGVDLDAIRPRRWPAAAGAPLLYLGRMCPEKGVHLAIEIARRARRRLWLAGPLAPFPDHQAYFQQQIQPHLGAEVRWLPAPALPQKLALLAEAAAVVVPSQIAESSSLVAMEAAAAGTPVLAWRAGALPEIVRDGVTGWLGASVEELAALVSRLRLPPRRGGIAPGACREHAERAFNAEQMAAGYAALYQRLGASVAAA